MPSSRPTGFGRRTPPPSALRTPEAASSALDTAGDPNPNYSLLKSSVEEMGRIRRAEAAQSPAITGGAYTSQDMETQMRRKWQVGDVYAPHDLTGVELGRWKKSIRAKASVGSKGTDILDILRVNPIHHYKNFAIMSEYMSETGRILHRNETGLRPVNQRRMAKAIRRAIGIGLMPSVHKHPEILRLDIEKRLEAERRRRPTIGM